jgi:hypothetical protein
MARADGNLDWLMERPALKGFHGLAEFERSVYNSFQTAWFSRITKCGGSH